MENIHVKVDWCDKNYGAVTECDALNGVMAVTNKTYDGLLSDLAAAVREHVSGCVADGDPVPGWLSGGEYDFNIEQGIDRPLQAEGQEIETRKGL